MIEESEIIEVKQGPYMGENEKQRFSGISVEEVRLKEEHEVHPGK
jgi:hypothetical protein